MKIKLICLAARGTDTKTEPYIRVIIIALEIIFVAASTDVAIIVVCLLNKQLLRLQTFSPTLLLSLSISFYLFLQTLY